MKSSVSQPPCFRPTSLTLTFENQQELDRFASMLNTTPIAEYLGEKACGDAAVQLKEAGVDLRAELEALREQVSMRGDEAIEQLNIVTAERDEARVESAMRKGLYESEKLLLLTDVKQLTAERDALAKERDELRKMHDELLGVCDMLHTVRVERDTLAAQLKEVLDALNIQRRDKQQLRAERDALAAQQGSKAPTVEEHFGMPPGSFAEAISKLEADEAVTEQERTKRIRAARPQGPRLVALHPLENPCEDFVKHHDGRCLTCGWSEQAHAAAREELAANNS